MNPKAIPLLILLPLIASSVASTVGHSADEVVFALARAGASSDPLTSGSVTIHSEGEVKVELDGALAELTYIVRFASATGSPGILVLGQLETNAEGDGSEEFWLPSGSYLGVFQLVRHEEVQYFTAEASFVISIIATTTTTVVTSTGTSTSTTNLNQSLTVQVEPGTVEVTAGRVAKFNIHVFGATAHEEINLSVVGVPEGATAIFSPPSSREAMAEFHSKLHIATGGAAAGSYSLTIFAVADDESASTTSTLVITGTPNVIETRDYKLHLGLETDKAAYALGEIVRIRGQVEDSSHNAVQEAQVSIEVVDDTGTSVLVDLAQTNTAGTFAVDFTLASDFHTGVYIAFAVASKGGFEDDRERTRFAVGQASDATIIIRDVRLTDTNGEEQALFQAGATLVVWVVVENAGAALERAMIWVQVRDPNGVPIFISIHLEQGLVGIKEVAVFITLSSNATVGVYTVNAFVSDNLISKGGKFLASQQAQFAVGT
jgi:hypothetical protein